MDNQKEQVQLGRKKIPLTEKKIPITIYNRQQDIDLLGGAKEVRILLNNHIQSLIKNQNNESNTN